MSASERTLPHFHFHVWQCPSCGWVVTDNELKLARVDFHCPRCGVYRLGEFRLVPATALEDKVNIEMEP